MELMTSLVCEFLSLMTDEDSGPLPDDVDELRCPCEDEAARGRVPDSMELWCAAAAAAWLRAMKGKGLR